MPVIYALRNALFLERPSAFQHQFVKSAEEERSHMTELEYKLINAKKKVTFEESKDSSDATEGMGDHASGVEAIQKNIRRKRGELKDKVQFKRKRAKVRISDLALPFFLLLYLFIIIIFTAFSSLFVFSP